MRVDTDLLWRWLAGTGRTIAGGSQGAVEVAAAIVPVARPIGPLTRISAVATETLRETTVTGQTVTVPASTAGSSTQVAIFGRGNWRLDLQASFVCDFALTPTNNPALIVQLLDPAGTNTANLLTLTANSSNNFPTVFGSMELVFPADGYQLKMVLPATAAAQTLQGSVSLLASRLL